MSHGGHGGLGRDFQVHGGWGLSGPQNLDLSESKCLVPNVSCFPKL